MNLILFHQKSKRYSAPTLLELSEPQSCPYSLETWGTKLLEGEWNSAEQGKEAVVEVSGDRNHSGA